MPSGLKARARANLAALVTLAALDAEARPATPSEQALLAVWSGWGGLSPMFDDTKDDWEDLRHQLRETLGEEEWKAARAGVLNAHYTHPAYVSAIWGALADMGLTQGRVLEPGCGSGTFIGLAPQGVSMTGVEVDPTTARIAQALYPQASIRAEGYEMTPTTHLFDATVGNVPFGDIRLFDPAGNPGNHSIHNHFIIKALNQTKPGGVVAVLSSHFTLDAANPAARRDMHERADLLGAIRLPSGAHQRVAGTQAVTDLLIFRVRKDGEEPQPFTWEHAHPHHLQGSDEAVMVNDYITANTARVLGTMRAGHGMYGATNLLVEGPDGDELATVLSQRLHQLTQAAQARGLTYDAQPAPTPTVAAATGVTDAVLGTLRASGDTFERMTEVGWAPVAVPKTQRQELRALLDLRDRTLALLDLERASATDTPQLATTRTALAHAYAAYNAQFGPLNRNTKTVRVKEAKDSRGKVIINETTGEPEVEETISVRRPPVISSIFSKDPHSALTRALENYDEDTGLAQGAPILSRRQVFARYTPKGADTPADALAISQDTKGRIDLDYVAYLLGHSDPTQARKDLDDLVFDTPEGGLVSREEYLSGNVRAKLDQARQALTQDPHFHANVDALTQVMPRDLGVADITPTPGAPWIPPSDHLEFARRALGISDATVTYNPAGGWEVKAWAFGTAQTSTWGTREKSATSIFQDMLNNTAIRVTHTETDSDGKKHVVFDAGPTEAAKAKAEMITERFTQWVWEDPQRTSRLLEDYNRRFNSLVPRSYDQAGTRLRLPGLASTFTLRSHQTAAIARMIAEPSTGLFHEVGAGKTLEMVCGIMEQKRLGLITKPMVVVPNHMLAQFEREWLQAYPQAKLLAADPDDISGKSGRGDFMARATTNDWDAIIVTQGAFKRIGVDKKTRLAYDSKELDELEEWIATSTDRMSVQRAQKKRETLKNQLAKAREKAASQEDPGVVFEQLGVDYLVVDEAHGYKNLSARTELQGVIAQTSSARAKDLDMKLDWLRRTHGERAATFATATPIANTMGEMWVMTHYLRPDLLQAAGLDSFDAWAKTFTGITEKVETTVGGGFKVRQRISRFHNMPELMTLWATFADVKTRDQLDLRIPDLAQAPDGQRRAQTITVNVGGAMEEFKRAIADRAEAIEGRMVDPTQDNWLSITSDGRAMSTDYRLLTGASAKRAFRGVTSPIGEQKVDRAADQIARIYHATKDHHYLDDQGQDAHTPGALQLVFCDQGTPKPGWNLYDQLKTLLIERGVPAEKIAFTHDAKNTVEKDQLFAKARTGAINVLIGSTEKMGTGANMQARAIALHHLTAPWRPADLAQRDGRIIRQGNQNPEVQIYRYVTEGSFDAYMWQTLERKSAFINQVMNGSLTSRDVEDADISEEEASYAQVKAIASGNPLIMEEARLKNQVSSLRMRADAHDAQQRYLTAQGPALDKQITILTHRAHMRDALTPRIHPTAGDAFTMRLDDTIYTTRADAAQALTAHFAPHHDTGRTPFYPNESNHIDYHRRGISDVKLDLGGLSLSIGVFPHERGLDGRVNTSKPVHFVATINDLHADNPYWAHGGPTFTLADLHDPNTAIGVIRKLENHVQGVAAEAAHLRAQAEEATEERQRVTDELSKPNPWTDKLHAARDQLANLHEQMTRAEHGQDTIPELSTTPRSDNIEPEADAGRDTTLDGLEQTRHILSLTTADPRATRSTTTPKHPAQATVRTNTPRRTL